MPGELADRTVLSRSAIHTVLHNHDAKLPTLYREVIVQTILGLSNILKFTTGIVVSKHCSLDSVSCDT
jgi:hypothetical protein